MAQITGSLGCYFPPSKSALASHATKYGCGAFCRFITMANGGSRIILILRRVMVDTDLLQEIAGSLLLRCEAEPRHRTLAHFPFPEPAEGFFELQILALVEMRHLTRMAIRNSGLASRSPAPYLRRPTHAMASTPVINLRKGHAVRHNNEVCLVTETELKTPPRMASYVQMSIRSVATKKMFNLRLTSNDSLEGVVLERTPHEYSYKDSSGYHFLDPNTYEDALVFEDLIENVKGYLIEGQTYTLLIADGIVVSVELPLSMTMKVTESSEGVKGDSANNVYKPAIMETGLVVQVPLFINVGEKINVKTEDNSYLGRA